MGEQQRERDLGARLPRFADAEDPLAIIAADPSKRRRWEANRKSVAKAYILWVLLGPFGGHRFYLGYFPSAIFLILLTGFAAILSLISFVGVFLLVPPLLWLLVDAAIIPAIVRHQNERLIGQILQRRTD